MEASLSFILAVTRSPLPEVVRRSCQRALLYQVLISLMIQNRCIATRQLCFLIEANNSWQIFLEYRDISATNPYTPPGGPVWGDGGWKS